MYTACLYQHDCILYAQSGKSTPIPNARRSKDHLSKQLKHKNMVLTHRSCSASSPVDDQHSDLGDLVDAGYWLCFSSRRFPGKGWGLGSM